MLAGRFIRNVKAVDCDGNPESFADNVRCMDSVIETLLETRYRTTQDISLLGMEFPCEPLGSLLLPEADTQLQADLGAFARADAIELNGTPMDTRRLEAFYVLTLQQLERRLPLLAVPLFFHDCMTIKGGEALAEHRRLAGERGMDQRELTDGKWHDEL